MALYLDGVWVIRAYDMHLPKLSEWDYSDLCTLLYVNFTSKIENRKGKHILIDRLKDLGDSGLMAATAIEAHQKISWSDGWKYNKINIAKC